LKQNIARSDLSRGVIDKEKTVSYLGPNLRYIDFFFSVQDLTKTFDIDAFFSTLKATKRIAYIGKPRSGNIQRQGSFILSLTTYHPSSLPGLLPAAFVVRPYMTVPIQAKKPTNVLKINMVD